MRYFIVQNDGLPEIGVAVFLYSVYVSMLTLLSPEPFSLFNQGRPCNLVQATRSAIGKS